MDIEIGDEERVKESEEFARSQGGFMVFRCVLHDGEELYAPTTCVVDATDPEGGVTMVFADHYDPAKRELFFLRRPDLLAALGIEE
jgi:hypothetical protein